MTDERIQNLEVKFSHQDFLMDQLNKIVAKQQIIIEKIQQDILELKLSQNENTTTNRTLEDDVPPHF